MQIKTDKELGVKIKTSENNITIIEEGRSYLFTAVGTKNVLGRDCYLIIKNDLDENEYSLPQVLHSVKDGSFTIAAQKINEVNLRGNAVNYKWVIHSLDKENDYDGTTAEVLDDLEYYDNFYQMIAAKDLLEKNGFIITQEDDEDKIKEENKIEPLYLEEFTKVGCVIKPF